MKSEMMQDGAKAHTAAATSTWLRDKEIHIWGKEVWLPNSPDLNPAEIFGLFLRSWWDLKRGTQTKKRVSRILEQLQKSLVEFWNKIRLETQENLYLPMLSRIKDVIRCKGGDPI